MTSPSCTAGVCGLEDSVWRGAGAGGAAGWTGATVDVAEGSAVCDGFEDCAPGFCFEVETTEVTSSSWIVCVLKGEMHELRMTHNVRRFFFCFGGFCFLSASSFSTFSSFARFGDTFFVFSGLPLPVFFSRLAVSDGGLSSVLRLSTLLSSPPRVSSVPPLSSAVVSLVPRPSVRVAATGALAVVLFDRSRLTAGAAWATDGGRASS